MRHLLYAQIKEATFSSYIRIHASFMVNMVAKKPIEPEDLWKIFTDRPKRIARQESSEMSPAAAKMFQDAFLRGAKEVIERGDGKQ